MDLQDERECPLLTKFLMPERIAQCRISVVLGSKTINYRRRIR